MGTPPVAAALGPAGEDGGHCVQGWADAGGDGSGTPVKGGNHGAGAGMEKTGGCGGVGAPWEPIKKRRMPWTAVTRSLMTPLICSGV